MKINSVLGRGSSIANWYSYNIYSDTLKTISSEMAYVRICNFLKELSTIDDFPTPGKDKGHTPTNYGNIWEHFPITTPNAERAYYGKNGQTPYI